MLTVESGHDVGYLTGAVARGREGYYTGAVAAGEPPGRWYGAGAELLGLHGEVDADLMQAVYTHLLDPRDPAAHDRKMWNEAPALAAAHRKYRSADDIYAELLDAHPDAGSEERVQLRIQAERSSRQAVAFMDVTFSAPKSVTVLYVALERAANEAAAAGDHEAAAAWSIHAKAVEEAVMAGATAAIDYLQDVAGVTRVGHHGGKGGRWIDAPSFVVAQFLQHDSRDRDPQLHVHQAILNRILCADGVWRALDGRAIHAARGAAGAIAERVMEAHVARSVGARVDMRPDGKAREVVGIDREVLDIFSSRSKVIAPRVQELLEAFEARFGRPASPYERAVIAQQVTLTTRRAKSHVGETTEQQLDRWEEMARTRLTGGLAPIARDVLARAQQAGPAAEFSPVDVIERAVAAVGETRQHYTRYDLMRAVSDALPGHLDIAPSEVRPLLEGLTDAALDLAVRLTPQPDLTDAPPDLLLADGSSVFARPGSTRYASAGQLAADKALREATVLRGAARFSDDQAGKLLDRFAESGRALGVDQAAALRGVLTSGAQVEVLCAAPGTGKSFVVGALSEAWAGVDGRRVFGLTPSQVAAGVLGEEGVTAAANTAAWLGAQRRLDARSGGADEAWRLRRDDLVVVDEANMAGTDHLAEIQQRCAAAGAKLLLVGDPRQLAAVGPGGALADVAEHGLRYELAEARRFTHDWERAASLRLREGDVDVLGEYDKHGRLRDAGTAEQAEAAASRAWLADTLAGRESLLMVGSNAAAARVSAGLRAELVSLGLVAETGVALGRDGWQGVVAGVGDLVQARRNGWELRGWAGNTRAPINRETYRVLDVRHDGGLTVAPITGRGDAGEELGELMALPASYVAADVTLAYASTVHAAEGRTVDTSHSVFGAGTDLAGVLVPMTRGREANTAWVVTTPLAQDTQTGETFDVRPRTARAILADVVENAREELSALAERERADVEARSTATQLDQLIAVAEQVTTGRTSAALDRLASAGLLSPPGRAMLAADDTIWSLERLLRTAELAGHDPEGVLAEAVSARGFDDARSLAQVIHHRITHRLAGRLTPHITSAVDLVPRDVPEDHRAWLLRRAEAADDRRRELGAQAAQDAPKWAVDALGPVPEDVVARQEWEHCAGWAAAWRELADHTDEVDPLGAAPARGMVEKAALFRAAHEALRLLDAGHEEAGMSDGQLRMRVRGWEREQAWAPPHVAEELAATHAAMDKARADAIVFAGRADAPDVAPADREQLRAAAIAARREAESLAEQASALEVADRARARWYTDTAVTRDKAERSAAELRARGVDPYDTTDHVTAEEWLDAARADQAVEEIVREIRDEYELHDAADAPSAHHEEHLDVRDRSTAHPSERIDPAERRRFPTLDETAEAVARAQVALTEIEERHRIDAERAARETEEAMRAEELARWSDEADSDSEVLGPEPALER
ncbi:MobF family relaxase [Pseudonocardia sp.]|uniref:MobF family relaxase n=1 Tax=Pseudonocardia sp. TaxID=60912 RepID=UPI003D146A10